MSGGLEGGRFESAVERYEGGEAGRGAVAKPLAPEPKNYPPQQVIRVRPGEPFSFTPILDPQRAEQIAGMSGDYLGGNVSDAVRIEVKNTDIYGEIQVVRISAYDPADAELPLIHLGSGGSLYAIDFWLFNVPEEVKDKVTFAISLGGESARAELFFDEGEEEGRFDGYRGGWGRPGEYKMEDLAILESELPQVQYVLDMEPAETTGDLPPTT